MSDVMGKERRQKRGLSPIIHDSPIYGSGFLLSLTIVAFFLWLGVSQFRKMEKTFADLI